jgi:hypothetical protein
MYTTSLCSLFTVNTSKLSWNFLIKFSKVKLKINGIKMHVEGVFKNLSQDSSVTTAHNNTNMEQWTLLLPIQSIYVFTIHYSLEIQILHSH